MNKIFEFWFASRFVIRHLCLYFSVRLFLERIIFLNWNTFLSGIKRFYSRNSVKRFSHPRVPSFLRNRPNVAFPLFSPAFRILGDTFIGAIRSAGLGLITRSVTFYSPMETPCTIGKPISSKSRDILPAALESILRHANARPFDTLAFGNTDVDKTRSGRGRGRERERERERMERKRWLQLSDAIHGLISMNSELHAAMSRVFMPHMPYTPRHPLARVYEHVELPAAQ